MGVSQTDWASWWPTLYEGGDVPRPYPGGDESYKLAGEYLAGDQLVEEWGCATTYGRQFIPAPYRGVDGGPSKWVDEVADLRTYRSDVPRALMRHVLEHNWEWRDILLNFLVSFQDRAVLILFIPVGEHDINRSFENRVGYPESPPGLQLDEASLFYILSRANITIDRDVELRNDTPPFGYERILFLRKGERAVLSPAPKCRTCGRVASTTLRLDLQMLAQRYEIAYTSCEVCAREKLDGLYALKVVPEVTWKTR